MLPDEIVLLKTLETQIQFLKNSGDIKLTMLKRPSYMLYKVSDCSAVNQQKILLLLFANENKHNLGVFNKFAVRPSTKGFFKSLKKPLLPVCWVELNLYQNKYNLTFILPRQNADMKSYADFIIHDVGMLSKDLI